MTEVSRREFVATSALAGIAVAAGRPWITQILKGAKPGDLPVRYPSAYFLTINTRATTALRLRLPPALLVQVDRVIS